MTYHDNIAAAAQLAHEEDELTYTQRHEACKSSARTQQSHLLSFEWQTCVNGANKMSSRSYTSLHLVSH